MKKVLRNPIVRAILQIVACGAGPVICGAVSAGISAASGGSLGDILQAAVFGYVVPQIWGAVGKAIEGVSRIGQALIHGVVNGAITAARGGCFLAGFASGVLGKVTSFASDILSHGDKVIDTAIVAAGGCAGAVIAKGSCANGAITAAFANMYNKWGEKQQSQCLATAFAVCGVGAATGSEIGATGGCVAGGPACPATGTAGAIIGGVGGCIVSGGAALAMCALGNSLSKSTGAVVHGNSSRSLRPTEVYYLINRSSGAIDKIGITSNPNSRYSRSYLQRENVYYQKQTQYQSRYPAIVDENIRLVHYHIKHGRLPRLNRVER